MPQADIADIADTADTADTVDTAEKGAGGQSGGIMLKFEESSLQIEKGKADLWRIVQPEQAVRQK